MDLPCRIYPAGFTLPDLPCRICPAGFALPDLYSFGLNLWLKLCIVLRLNPAAGSPEPKV